MSNIKKD